MNLVFVLFCYCIIVWYIDTSCASQLCDLSSLIIIIFQFLLTMGLFCCGGFGICCLVMKTLWANTFAVLISMVSPYPYTTAACLLPIILYLVHRFLLPYISTFWSSKQVQLPALSSMQDLLKSSWIIQFWFKILPIWWNLKDNW